MFKPHQIIYFVILSAGFVAGMISWKRNQKHPSVVMLLGLTLLSELISRVFAYTIQNNSYVYHFFNPIQAIVWGWFFYANLKGLARKTIIPSLVLLTLFAAFNTTCLQWLNVFPANFIRFETVLLLFWSFSLFIQFLDRPSNEHIFSNSVFITCIAVMWFNLTSFLFFQLFNFYIDHQIPTDSIRSISYFSNYTYYSLLLVAMCLKDTSLNYEYK